MTPHKRRQLLDTIITSGNIPLVLRMNAENEEFDSISRYAIQIQESGDVGGLT